jgi:hypothetical protein
MKVLTPEVVKAFWSYMCKHYGTTAVNKPKSAEMKIAAHALELMGIMDASDFLSEFSTTVGERIYIPFKPGDTFKVSLVDQAAICVHEHVHVRQFKHAQFIGEYCLDSSKRALYECEAYRASMETSFYLVKDYPSPKAIAESLKAYNCNEKDRMFAKKYLTQASAIVRRGGVVTPETKVAKAWLEKVALSAIAGCVAAQGRE